MLIGIAPELGAFFYKANGFCIAFIAKRFFHFDIDGFAIFVHFKRKFHRALAECGFCFELFRRFYFFCDLGI